MQELVADGHTGLHFSSGDPNDLAAKVEQAWSHPNEMIAMDEEPAPSIRLSTPPNASYPMLMDIYKRALQNYGRTQTISGQSMDSR